MTKLETIHASHVNGQMRQLVEQIDDYGLYEFWADYRDYLSNLYKETESQLDYFTSATIAYFRIKNR